MTGSSARMSPMFESSALAFSSGTFTLASNTAAQGAMEGTWIGDLQNWVDGLPEALQWLGIIAIAAIPFLESFTASLLGVLISMPWWAALISGIIGNTAAVAILVYGAHGIRTIITQRKAPAELSDKQVARRAKIKKYLDRFGVPGVSILGPLALPSQFTAPLLVSFGANRNLVMLWMFASICLWGGLFVLLGIGILALLGN